MSEATDPSTADSSAPDTPDTQDTPDTAGHSNPEQTPAQPATDPPEVLDKLNPDALDPQQHRAGFIALVGRPNAGKSTLLNAILGQKISITSHRPQTTRNRIVGIHSEPGLQAIVVDTPGLHRPQDALNQAMVDTARSAMTGVDLVTWVVDGRRVWERLRDGRPVFHKGHEAILARIDEAGEHPKIVAINKIDQVPTPQLLPIIAAFSERVEGAEFLPISALGNDGLDTLKQLWARHLPTAPPLFPPHQITEHSERFIVGEMIREKVFRHTRQEIPYATAVVVEDFAERPAEDDQDRGVVAIFARIIVERPGQRGIIIGKGGKMIKAIGSDARADIERMLGTVVHLDLHVSVRPDWSSNPRDLHELGLQ